MVNAFEENLIPRRHDGVPPTHIWHTNTVPENRELYEGFPDVIVRRPAFIPGGGAWEEGFAIYIREEKRRELNTHYDAKMAERKAKGQ